VTAVEHLLRGLDEEKKGGGKNVARFIARKAPLHPQSRKRTRRRGGRKAMAAYTSADRRKDVFVAQFRGKKQISTFAHGQTPTKVLPAVLTTRWGKGGKRQTVPPPKMMLARLGTGIGRESHVRKRAGNALNSLRTKKTTNPLFLYTTPRQKRERKEADSVRAHHVQKKPGKGLATPRPQKKKPCQWEARPRKCTCRLTGWKGKKAEYGKRTWEKSPKGEKKKGGRSPYRKFLEIRPGGIYRPRPCYTGGGGRSGLAVRNIRRRKKTLARYVEGSLCREEKKKQVSPRVHDRVKGSALEGNPLNPALLEKLLGKKKVYERRESAVKHA